MCLLCLVKRKILNVKFGTYETSLNIVFHGRSDEQIRLIDVSYVPDLKFNIFSFHKAQQTHVIILDAAGAHIMGKKPHFPLREERIVLASDPACARYCRNQAKDEPSTSQPDFCPPDP